MHLDLVCHLLQGVLAYAQTCRISLIIQADDDFSAFLFAKADREMMISFQVAKEDFFSRISLSSDTCGQKPVFYGCRDILDRIGAHGTIASR